jgi:hypothetical protein
LDADDAAVVCENCNNCVVPQAGGAAGVCRSADVLERAGRLRKAGAYERDQPDASGVEDTDTETVDSRPTGET